MLKPILWTQLIAILTFTVYTNPAGAGEIKRKYFNPSQLISFENTKTELKEIYLKGGKRETFHCGCFFDELLQVSSGICSHSPKSPSNKPISEYVEWVHAMPLHLIGEKYNCSAEKSCAPSTSPEGIKQRCCNQVSPKFKIIQADMHNIFPSIRPSKPAEENNTTPVETDSGTNAKDYDLPVFGGMEEYKLCTEKSNSIPIEKVRGDLARAYFYTSIQYRIPIPQKLEDQLRTWHYQDPPDGWEEKRNTLIETVQGNRNPFIDHPELAERVKDF